MLVTLIRFVLFVSFWGTVLSDCFKDCSCDIVLNKKTIICSTASWTQFKLSGIAPDENVSILSLADNELQNTNGKELARAFPELTFLDLDNNNFTELKKSSFVSMNNLKTLLVSKNEIHKIDKDTFRDQTELETLKLSHNKLTVVESEWLKSMAQLKDLNLDSNMIEDFKPTMFEWNSRLIKLSLKNNKFKIMPPLPTASNAVVDLQNNNISCNCKRQVHDSDKTLVNATFIGGCKSFLTGEGLESISVCVASNINGGLKKFGNEIAVHCEWTGFPYPEVRLMSSGEVLARNHGNHSRLSYGPVNENGNYVCKAENVAGIAVYNITTNVDLANRKRTKNIITMVYALLASFLISFTILSVIKIRLNQNVHN